MANYPEGVTGRESQIVGPDEVMAERACNATDVTLTSLSSRDRERLLRVQEYDTVEVCKQEVAIVVANTSNSVTFAECPFEGEVLLSTFAHESSWTCPLCGTEHNEEYDRDDEREYEPEDYYDA